MKAKIIILLNLILMVTMINQIKATYILTDADVVVSNGVLSSCSYNFADKDIIIPEELDGQVIKEIIGKSTYTQGIFYNKGITSVVLPASIEIIGENAFRTNAITSLTIPNTVTKIEGYAFYDNLITSLEIPTSVIDIEIYAFRINALTSVTFASNTNIAYIGYGAFYTNPSLTSISLPTHANPNFSAYKKSDGTTITAIAVFNDFYYADIPYTLASDDVVVVDGYIESCSYNFASKTITIPNSLDGQTVIGIANTYIDPFHYRNLISVVLPNTLEIIEAAAFIGNHLTSITIPSTVTEIGNSAFSENSLTSLTIPNSVVTIGSKAFYKNNLSSVAFASNSNILSIGSEAFKYNSLTSITLPTHANPNFIDYRKGDGTVVTEMTDFNYGVTYYANIQYTLTSDDVVVTDGVLESCSYNTLYKNIIIPETLDEQTITAIGGGSAYSGAFYNKGLIFVELPATLEIVDKYAFYKNELINVTIPSSVQTIKYSAFQDNELDSVAFENNSNIIYIESRAFYGNWLLDSIVLPVHADPNWIDYRNTEGIIVTQMDKVDYNLGYFANIPYTLTDDDVIVTNGNLLSYSDDILYRNIIIPDVLDMQYVKTISDAFSSKGLAIIQLPSILEVVEDNAFYNNLIANITIPNSVNSIGDNAFKNNSLTSITIPNSVTFIGNNAFNSNSLITITIPNSVESIEDYAFNDNDLTSVTFEANSNIINIGSSAFANNPSLSSITLPTHANPNVLDYRKSDGLLVTQIIDFIASYYANVPYTLTDNDVVVTNGTIEKCDYNTSYKNIIIPEVLDGQTVVGIGDSWVFSNKGISMIQLPVTLESIGKYAFQNNSLASVSIPNSVTIIGDNAFRDNSLTGVIISNSVESIGGYAFYNNSISSLVIPTSIISIGNSAFRLNALTSVNFTENSTILYIDAYAFKDNPSLASITLPTHVNPDFIDYRKSDNTTVSAITDYNVYYYANIPYTLTDNDVEVTNGIIESLTNDLYYKNIIIPNELDGQTVIGIADKSSSTGVFYNKKLVSVQLPNTLENIGNYAFRYCSLTSITIPNSITTIGYKAFENNSLTSVTFEDNSNLLFIDKYAFTTNSLTNIVLPTHANPSFIEYLDDDGNVVTEITNFGYITYSANIPYTLTDDDVVVVNGIIISCDYNTIYKTITIPETLDGQTVIGIADGSNYYSGVFRSKGIAELYLPSTLETIGNGAFSRNNLTSITLPNSVTSIGMNAFESNQLDSVFIPESITSIRGYSFRYNSLDTIFIPNSVTSIESFAFYSNNLTSIDIPNSVTSIGHSAFRNNSLTSVVIPSSITIIEDYVFNGNSLTNVTIPNSVTSIGSGAFANNSIPSIVIPESVTNIGDYAFNSNSLTALTLPNSVESIGRDAFSSNALNSITIPNSVISIDKCAFRNNSLTSVIIPNSLTTIENNVFENNLLTSITIPSTVTSIGYSAFSSNLLTSVNIPSSVTTIESYAFRYNSLTSVPLPNSIVTIGDYAFNNNDLISIVIPNSVTTIGANAFSYNSLTNLTIPSSVKNLGSYALAYNSITGVTFETNSNILNIGTYVFYNNSLSSITLPVHANSDFVEYRKSNGTVVTEITDFVSSYYAYIPYTLTDNDVVVIDGIIESCSYNFELKNIIIPETLDNQTVIGIGDGEDNNGVFSRKNITGLQLPVTLKSIGNYAFYINSISSITIPNTVTSIGDYAFNGNSLSSITIPNLVTSIGIGAFRSNSLTSVSIPSSLTSIENYAFSINLLTSVSIPNSVTAIGEYAFNNNNLISVVLGNSITTIGKESFGSNQIESLILPNSVTTIGGSAFRNNSLQDIVIPSSVITIGEAAFTNNLLETVTISDGVKSIEKNAFYGNALTSVFIPNSVTSIGDGAFKSNQITDMTFESNSNILFIGNSAFASNPITVIDLPSHAHPDFVNYIQDGGIIVDEITNFNTSYYVDITYMLTDDDVEVVDGFIVSCSYDFSLISIIIPNTLDGQTVIGIADDNYGVFYRKRIREIQLPATLEYIGDNAFNYNNLTSITLPFSVEYIGESAFYGNSLTSINIPNTVTTIGEYAFISNSLTSLYIPNSVKSIGREAFEYNELTEVTFQDNSNILSIDQSAFRSNVSLDSIILPTHVNPYFAGYFNEEGEEVTVMNDFDYAYYVDFPYTLTDDDVEVSSGYITKYNIRARNIIIPEVLDGQTVIGISDGNSNYNNGIFEYSGIFSVQLPNTIEYIGKNAFSDNEFTSIVIPNSVTEIADYAFSYGNLTDVIIPKSVIKIDYRAFSGNNIANVTFEPNSNISFIGEYAFLYNSIGNITLPTHASSNFSHYTDTNTNSTYAEGDVITDFRYRYKAVITPYTVVFEDYDGTVLKTETIEHGQSVTAPSDPSRYGYLFTEWDTDFSLILSDTTITAQYIRINNIIYNLAGGSYAAGVSNPATYLATDATITLAGLSKTDYVFNGWYTDATFTNLITKIQQGSTGDLELWAKFSPVEYSITYNLNGGINSVNNPTGYSKLDAITLDGAIKTGFTFVGWYSDESLTTPVTEIFSGSSGNIVLWAKYTLINYTITYNLNGGTNDGANPVSYTVEDASILLANATKTNYSFAGWYSDVAFVTQVTEISQGSSGNIELWAKFSADEYTITYNLDGGTNDPANPTAYSLESAFTFAPAIKSGYTFSGWYSDVALTTPLTEITIGSSGNIELWAKFTLDNYTLTYNLDGGTNSVTNPASYSVEDITIPLTDAIKTGYSFSGWYSDAAFESQVTEIAQGSTGNIELWAKFTLMIYSIAYNLDGGTNDAGNPTEYTIEHNAMVLGTATKQGYTFLGWYSDASFTTPVTEIVQGSSGNLQLWAKYVPIEYSVTYNLNGGTNNGANPATFTIENSAILLAEASKVGYTFNGWFTDASLTNKVKEIAQGSIGNVELWAKFTLKNYSITYNLNGGTNGVTNPVKYSIESDTIFLAAATKGGYNFDGWYSDATFTTLVSNISKGSSGNIELWAKFSTIEYTVTYNLDGAINNANNPTTFTVESATTILGDAKKTGCTFEGWYRDAAHTMLVLEISQGSIGNIQLFAKFNAIEYTISYNLDGALNDASNPIAYTVNSATIIFADATKPGYTFNGWYSDENYATQLSEISTGSTGNIQLFAKFTATEYNITYNLDGGINNESNPLVYTVESATIVFDEASKTGHTFMGWYTDDTYTTPISQIWKGSLGNIELWAKFIITEYTIVYNLHGGINDSLNPTSYTINDTAIVLGNASKNGYDFMGWYTDAEFENQVTEIPDSIGDVELWAKFSAIEYSIIYNLNGGINNSINPLAYTVADVVTFADASKNGYTFVGWYSDSTFTNHVILLPLGTTGNIELWAKFIATEYFITYHLNGGSNHPLNPITYTVNDSTIILGDASKTGYNFAGWFRDIAFTNSIKEIEAGSTDDMELWAKFTLKTFVLSFNITDGINPIENAIVNFNGANYTTNENYEVVIGDIVNGTYSYTVFAEGFNTTFGMVTINGEDKYIDLILVATTGINDGMAEQIKFYPNPATNMLTVEYSFKIQQISVLNITGEIIYVNNDLSPETNMLQIDVSNFKQGIYFIAVDEFVEKFVKE